MTTVPQNGARVPTYGPSALATPANAVTIGRLVVTPLLLVMIVRDGASWPNFVMWVVLAATDGVDGYIARRHGTTRSGAFLDPLADKVLVLGAMAALIWIDVFSIIPVALIAARELAISLYRVYWGRQGLAVPARQSAKVKTVVQALAVGVALMPSLASLGWIAETLLWASVFLALLSAYQYLRDGRRAVTSMRTTD